MLEDQSSPPPALDEIRKAVQQLVTLKELELRDSADEQWYRKWSFRIGTVVGGVLAAFVAMIAVISLIIQWNQREIIGRQAQTQSSVQEIKRQVDAIGGTQRPVVDVPDGGQVEQRSFISGRTPLLSMNHYIVITPVETQISAVQDSSISIAADGTFRAQAQFGQGENGVGKQFVVEVWATNTQLPPGVIRSLPPDVVRSAPVTVTRVR